MTSRPWRTCSRSASPRCGGPETLSERLDTTAELVELTESGNDPQQQFWALVWRGVTVVQAGDVAGADRCLQTLRALTDRLGQPRLRFVLGTQEAWRAQLAGRLEEAERLADAASALGMEAGEPDALSLYAAQLGSIRWQQGRLRELGDLLAQIVDEAPGVAVFGAMQALAELEAGREQRARSLLERAAANGFAAVPADTVELGTLVLWAELAAHLGDGTAAAALLERLGPWREQIVLDSLGTLGSVARAVGMLAAQLGVGRRPTPISHTRWTCTSESGRRRWPPARPWTGEWRCAAAAVATTTSALESCWRKARRPPAGWDCPHWSAGRSRHPATGSTLGTAVSNRETRGPGQCEMPETWRQKLVCSRTGAAMPRAWRRPTEATLSSSGASRWPRELRDLRCRRRVARQVVANAAFVDRLDTSDEWIVRRTGIHERRWLNGTRSLADLAAEACAAALDDAHRDAAAVDRVIVLDDHARPPDAGPRPGSGRADRHPGRGRL